MTIFRSWMPAVAALAVAILPAGSTAWSQAPASAAVCGAGSEPSFCSAVRGVRAEGWGAQSRSEVMSQHGMVVTSQPLAAQAGLETLKHGGNAVDAAVAAAAVLNVVEPMMEGLGGDLFAVIYIAKERKVYVLNASGTAPSGATLERFNELGYRWDPQNWGPMSGMPVHGILPVTVPGAAWGWQEVLRRFGTLTFKQVLEPAVHYAEEGFPVSERIASDWQLPDALPLRACCSKLDPDSVRTWYENGSPPKPGEIFKNPELARTFRLLQTQGADAFYKGAIAKAIVAKSTALGGTMTLEDLSRYHGEWVDGVRTQYHGYDLVELPPPSQAWAANEMLNILQACLPQWAPGKTLASLGPTSPLYWHLLVEAKKLAYADLYHYNADPHFAVVPLQRLLSDSYASSLCARVDPARASTPGPIGHVAVGGDTIVLSTADRDGNMVSWVNSNFDEFGSGITVPGFGFILHDRGALFTLDPTSPNVIQPQKRPFNTLAAGFLLHEDDPVMTVTLMGGDMQAQGHAQLMVDVIDLGANVQAAADMARFLHSQIPNQLQLEAPLYDLVGKQLTAMGHSVKSIDGESVGGVQVIRFVAAPGPSSSPSGSAKQAVNGYYRAGSDFRKDGQGVGW